MKLRNSLSILFFIVFVSDTDAIESSFARPGSDDRTRNCVTFRCILAGESVTLSVYMANDLTMSSPLSVTSGTDGFVDEKVTLTPYNESYFICESDNNGNPISSEPIYFAAIPDTPAHAPPMDRRLVRVGDQVSLSCPYNLGIASGIIMPYHYIWFNGTNELTEQTNKTFVVNVTDDLPNNTMYSCGLRIKDCSHPDCLAAVGVYPSLSFRQTFKVKKVVPLSIDEAPESQQVDHRSEAVFHCSASGTSIDIVWGYDGMNYTSDANDCSPDSQSSVCVIEEGSSNLRSSLVITSVSMNGTVFCFARQSFDGIYNSSLPNNTKMADATLTVMEVPLTPSTTMPSPMPTTMTTTTADNPTTTPSDLMIAFVSLGVVAVIAVTIAVTIVLSLIFHYHYKYKTDSKLGRFLSRAVSSRPSNRIIREADLPSNGNGEVLSSVFQPASDYHHSSQSRGANQDHDQIYNTSQYSKSSGGSYYSGLSGVSNQEPGAIHKMPDYCATDVSGGSTYNPQSSVTYDGLLAPPHTAYGNGSSRSQRSSDVSDGSNQSRSKAPRLTQELLSQMQKAVSSDGINGPQSYSGYQSYQLHNNQQHHHSDLGFLSRRSQEHIQPPLNLLPTYSPAGAAVSTNSPYVQGAAPFPHCRTPQSGAAPFPSKHTNKEQRISEDTIKVVVKCLMHNKNCRIPNCPCYQIQELYKNTTDKNGSLVMTKQQSYSSDSSDSVSDKKKNLHLSLSPKETSKSQDFIAQLSREDLKVHPHYHRGTKSRVRSHNPKPSLERRRSKSVDLSPLGECSESPTKTPTVGGSLIAGTPVYAPRTLEDAITEQGVSKIGANKFIFHQRTSRSSEYHPDCCDQGSMSADDLPTLCLNDCPLANTSKPNKLKPPVKRVSSGKPKLSPIGEKHKEAEDDGWSGFDSSHELARVCSSDRDGDSARGVSVNNSVVSQSQLSHYPVREISNGYHSETLSSDPIDSFKLKPKTHRNLSSKSSSDHSQRSTSPAYETIVTVSDDGNRVHTTEC